MDILHLTLKKQWFDMIASGTKREEYREVKPYWRIRFYRKKYGAIQFRNGYSKDSPTMLIELKEIVRGLGIIEWGAPAAQLVFILRLGNILKHDSQSLPNPEDQ
jgi:hypothetical protein